MNISTRLIHLVGGQTNAEDAARTPMIVRPWSALSDGRPAGCACAWRMIPRCRRSAPTCIALRTPEHHVTQMSTRATTILSARMRLSPTRRARGHAPMMALASVRSTAIPQKEGGPLYGPCFDHSRASIQSTLLATLPSASFGATSSVFRLRSFPHS